MSRQFSASEPENFPVAITLPVVWGEMDAFGHVNNAVYFRYFETARIAYFERIGMLQFMEKQGIGPILAHTECRFRIPLTYPDSVEVGARVTAIEADRFLMQYQIWSQTAQAVAARGSGLIVSFDYRKACKVAIPAELRERLCELEGRQF